MADLLKKSLYFFVASYFRFFARIRLHRWNPKIIVVTGSNGKTTLLQMLESQLGKKACYSHHANSAFGICFDILGLHRKTLQKSEWISLFLTAPMQSLKKNSSEKIYVVEADVDRPYEGKFLAELLRPEIVLWVSTGRTHSENFDTLVSQHKFKNVEEAIAFEYGYFAEYCKEKVFIDGDSDLMKAQLSRTQAEITQIRKEAYFEDYSLQKYGTKFVVQKDEYHFSGLLPKELFLSIALCKEAVSHVHETFDPKFTNFTLPPGRGTVLPGIKDTVLIDSSYNGNLGSIRAVLSMFIEYPAQRKWVVLGDMKELGKEEQEEHEKLAKLLNEMNFDRIILIGKIISKYTLPEIKDKKNAMHFEKAPDALSYLFQHITGEEAILFKGSQSIFLEGLIEPLLKDKEDSKKLPRRDPFWKSKRRKLGFDSQ